MNSIRFASLKDVAVSACLLMALPFGALRAEDLANMSLEALANANVTSVSKSAESLRSAPASIYVITRDDVIRSGATSLPEILRLAPNLDVRQSNAKNYVAAARGFAGNPDLQSFANKILILIDGRSVYTPLFSGVAFDAQDTFIEDIERIEVISGPGATLWGANAMNGVINIITRSASRTEGGVIGVGAGNQERNVGARFGGRFGDAAYRVYGKAFKRDPFELTDGTSAHDDWRRAQIGFRVDWADGADTVTAQGDAYRALQGLAGAADLQVEGANVLSRWQRRGESSEFQLQAYFDHAQRAEPPTGVASVVHTYDLEFQQTFAVDTWLLRKFTWGAGERFHRYSITNTQSLLFEPSERTLRIGNVFALGTLAFGQRVQLSLGLKLEEDPFDSWELLPDARLSWNVGRSAMVWASASRAIRSPTPFDHDVIERVGGVDFLVGNPAFEPERVNAYEIGYRDQPASRLSYSIAAFYNDYDDLRSIEVSATPTLLPLRWGNLLGGTTYGAEAWATWQVLKGWRLSPGVRVLKQDFEFEPGASRLGGIAQVTNDPSAQASLRSSMDFPGAVTVDLNFRYVGALPEPQLKEYYELNARIGWGITESLDLSLSGVNLLHPSHRESPVAGDALIGRSVFAEARWSF
jgi:iron complex outermembrane receptor protein